MSGNEDTNGVRPRQRPAAPSAPAKPTSLQRVAHPPAEKPAAAPRVRERVRPAATALPIENVPDAADKLEVEKNVLHGEVLVQRTLYGVEEELRRERIAVPVFHTQAARVRVAAGVTLNMGDYNSGRVDVAVELPCYPTVEEVRRTSAICAQEVEAILHEQAANLKGSK